MARRRRYKPIARIRRALLLALIVLVGAIVGYYVTGGFRPDAAPDGEATPDDEPFSVGEGVLTVAHGFDYEVTENGVLEYRVRAEQLVSDVQDRMDLAQMEVELPQENGGTIVVVADRGTIHLDSKSATLDGSVRAVDENGMELAGDGFEVVRDGRQLISKSPVTFGRAGEYTGSAEELHYSIKKERLQLEGDVVIETVPKEAPEAGSLRCQKLFYDRLEGTLRLEGEVRVTSGSDYLEADRLSMTLDETGEELRFVRAEGGVRGRFMPESAAGDPESRVDFRGKVLYATFEAGTGRAETAELRGGRRRPDALLDMVDASGLSRLLLAPVILAEFDDGEVTMVDAQRPVVLVERLSFAPAHLLRRVCADRARVEFDDLGEVAKLNLIGGVDYQASDIQVQGDRIDSIGGSDRVTISGRPALVLNERGDLRAPRITYSEGGLVIARGGVRAELTRESGFSLMGEGSEEPVRVKSDEARWTQDPEQVLFTGSVRAWQGGDYLLAERVLGEPKLDRLTATDDVKTVLKRKSAGVTGSDPGAGEGEPIEITAEKLIYEQPRRVITYEGGARAVQAARVLECDTMDVELDHNDEFDRLLCVGTLRLDDPAQGRTVRGDRAVYVPGADEVDITGDPVVLTDTNDGTQLEGGRIIYRFDTGAAQISSRPLQAAEPGGETG